MRLVRKWFPYFFLAYWLVVFFPQWYALTYTKVWELRRLALRGRDQQMRVLHSGEMAGLLALRERLGTLPVESTYVWLGEGSANLPLAGNPAMARAVLFPYAAGPLASLPESTTAVVRLAADCTVQTEEAVELPYGAELECWGIKP
jgi:hypothetical protein